MFALSNARLQAVPIPKLKAKFVTKSRIAAFGAVCIKFSQRLYGKFQQIFTPRFQGADALKKAVEFYKFVKNLCKY